MPRRRREKALQAFRAALATQPPPPEEMGFLERLGGPRGLAATGVRGLSGFLSVMGGLPGAAISGAGETAAEAIEGRLNPARIATEAGLGAVPFGKVFQAGRTAQSALRGGLYAGVGAAGRQLSEGQPLDSGAITLSTLLGGGIGGGLARLTRPRVAAAVPEEFVVETSGGAPLRTIRGAAPEPPPVPREMPPLVRPAEEVAAAPAGRIPFGTPESAVSEAFARRAATAERARAQRTGKLEREFSRGMTEADRRFSARQKAEEIARTAERIAAERAGLVPQPPRVSESISAPIPGGRERMTISYKAPGEEEGLEELGDILGAPRATGRPGRASWREVEEAPTTPVAPVTPEAPITPTPALTGPRAAPPETEFSVGAARRAQQAERAQAERDRLAAKLEPEAPVAPTAPEAAGGEVAELRNLLGIPRMDIVGGHYQALQEASKAGEVPKEAARIAGRALTREAQAVGLPTRGRVTPPAAPAEEIGLYGTAPITEAEKAAGRVPSRPMTPEEIATETTEAQRIAQLPEAERRTFIEGLRDLGTSERGAVNPELLAQIGGAGLGALAGGAVDPFGDPLLSMLAGGAAGFIAPTVASRAASQRMAPVAARAAADPALDATQKAATQAMATPEGLGTFVNEIYQLLPQYVRANLLISPNLLNNALTGPIGSGYLGALEHYLSGDPRGLVALKSMNPLNWTREFTKTWDEALKLTGARERAEGPLLGEVTGELRRAIATPGTLMTMGDVTTRRILMNAGFTEQEARRLTLTLEPEFAITRRLADLPRSSPLGQTLMPFSRTLANVMEQGAERMPGLGFVVQAARETPDAFQKQLTQQAIATGVGAGAAGIGYAAPEDPAWQRFVRSFASNIGGPYSLQAGMGYALGRAARAGASPRQMAGAAAIEGVRSTPLPTVRAPEEWIRFLTAEPGTAEVPGSLYPRYLVEGLRGLFEGPIRRQ